MDHHLSIASEGDGGWMRTRCSCGWRGHLTRAAPRARTSGRRHLAEVGIPPEPEPRKPKRGAELEGQMSIYDVLGDER